MKKTLTTAAVLALLGLAACADFKLTDATMTRADVQAREDGITGWAVSEAHLDAIIAGTPSLAHLAKK